VLFPLAFLGVIIYNDHQLVAITKYMLLF